MPQRLSLSLHAQIDAMIDRDFSTEQILLELPFPCSARTIQRKRLKRQCAPKPTLPSTPSNPFIRIGRGSFITPYMQDILRSQLLKEPLMYRSEMITFLYKKTGVEVSLSAMSRSLKAMGWTRKTARRIARQRDDELREAYLHRISRLRAEHFVFIDESGCDKKAGERRMGWAPSGKTPVKINALNRDKRYQILPAYTVDGILLARIYTGSTDAAWFEDFVEQLLHHCGKWPEPRSVLVMDNASWHNKERLERLCADAGVKLLFLPPYSPDFNPIEEFFSEFKSYIKKCWNEYYNLIKADFKAFLRLCIRAVGSRKASARGHFRNAGIPVEEPHQ